MLGARDLGFRPFSTERRTNGLKLLLSKISCKSLQPHNHPIYFSTLLLLPVYFTSAFVVRRPLALPYETSYHNFEAALENLFAPPLAL